MVTQILLLDIPAGLITLALGIGPAVWLTLRQHRDERESARFEQEVLRDIAALSAGGKQTDQIFMR
ncbi:MAG: hypothetical protein ACYDH5_08255 [Acidimicrobiales bacterium]